MSRCERETEARARAQLRLSADQATEARAMWRDGALLCTLADRYGVGIATIHRALTGATHGDVKGAVSRKERVARKRGPR